MLKALANGCKLVIAETGGQVHLKLVLLAGAALAAATPVRAADAPKYGAAPAWVVPQTIPQKATKAADAPVALLLSDQQSRIEPGKITTFTELAMKIQTADGLAAGNISLPWEPAADTITINRLHIIRQGKVIDVLAAGQTFTVLRRETNLDAAVLDGTLTANIQPEGLQVGDVIDLAVTNEHVEPVLSDHVENVFATWNSTPLEYGHVRLSWPASMKVLTRQSDLLPKPLVSTAGGTTTFELSSRGIEPLVPPSGAPARFRIGPFGELTNFSSWSDLSDRLRPLYEKAAVIPPSGPLRDELEAIRKSAPSPKQKAEKALQLVEQRVRYLALEMGVGGLVPAAAETTWSRRFGDCKGKTALLLGLLHELGIEAEPVLVHHNMGDILPDRLPMATWFDHVLVRARIGGEDYWLDGTRTGDRNLDQLRVPNFGWGLPLTRNAALVRMVPPPLDEPSSERRVDIDASDGLYAPARISMKLVYRDDSAVALNALYSAATGTQRDSALRDQAKEFFDGFAVTSSSVKFDQDKRELTVAINGTARLNWKDGWFYVPTSSIAFNPDFDRPAGPLHDAPFAVAFPRYAKDIATIRLPAGLAAKEKLSPPVHETLAGVEYRRTQSVNGDVLTVESSERSIEPEVTFKSAVAVEGRLRALERDDVYLRIPPGYRPTKADEPALADLSLSSASEYLGRGNMYLDAAKFDEAIADLTQAHRLEPKNPWALAGRGLAYAWKRDFDRAASDFAAAEAIDPENPVVLRGRGLVAELKGDFVGAVQFLSRSLAKDPKNGFALAHRAKSLAAIGKQDEALEDLNQLVEANPSDPGSVLVRASVYFSRGEEDKALADVDASFKLGKATPEARLLRANILRRQGKHDLVVKEADLLIRENPKSDFALVAAGKILSAEGQRDRALQALDAALAIKRSAYIYINRSQVRAPGDFAARIADIDEALKLEPANTDALMVKADLLKSRGRYAEAVDLYGQVAKATPQDINAAVQQAVALYRSGQKAESEKLFAQLRSKATMAAEFNNLCWTKATADVFTQTAVADCEKALELSPGNGAMLDSLGMALLKVGKLDEALAAYGKAIAAGSGGPSSLMGRAFVYLKKGDRARAEADAAAARAMNPEVDSEFAGYGLKFPGTGPAAAAAAN